MMRATAAMLTLALALPAMGFAVEVERQAAAVRDQIDEVERMIDRSFRGVGEDAPITTLGTARGVYLEGYGALFTVEVNLVPSANLSPFRRSYSEEEKRRLNVRKRQRLETLQQKGREILLAAAEMMTAVPEGEQVALALSLFHFTWEDLTELPRQMVLAAARGALDQARSGALDAAELRRRFSTRYF